MFTLSFIEKFVIRDLDVLDSLGYCKKSPDLVV